jgi:hypothetical protein
MSLKRSKFCDVLSSSYEVFMTIIRFRRFDCVQFNFTTPLRWQHLENVCLPMSTITTCWIFYKKVEKWSFAHNSHVLDSTVSDSNFYLYFLIYVCHFSCICRLLLQINLTQTEVSWDSYFFHFCLREW